MLHYLSDETDEGKGCCLSSLMADSETARPSLIRLTLFGTFPQGKAIPAIGGI